MEDNSKDSRRIEKTPSDHEVDSTTADIGEESTECSSNSTSSENVQQEVASVDKSSASEDGDTLPYRDTEFENEEDSDDCADVERKYKAPKNLPSRTYSDSHLPVDEIPQLQIYDSDAKNKGKKNISRYEKNLESFKEASRTIRDQSETTVEQRLINSDGEIAKMSYSEMTEINSDLSLKRSVSTPLEISAETRRRRKYRVSKLRNDLFKSGGTSLSESDESCRTKSELSETKCTTESSNKKTLPISAEDAGPDKYSRLYEGITENINPANVEGSSIKQALSSDSETETSSETSCLMELEEKSNFFLENISGIETSCSLRESETSGISHVVYLNPPSGRISDLNTSPDISVITGTKTKSPLQHDLGPEEDGSSESSEISRILDSKTLSPTFIEYYSSTDNETSSSSEYSFTNIADIGKDKSPPKITAEPPSVNSGIFKVPSKMKDCSTSSDLSLSQKPKGSSVPSSPTKRPTDFNVDTRSLSYTFDANSPTGLVLRPYRSLPNVNMLPRYNVLRSGTDFSNLHSGVVRSLFTGDLNSNQHGSSFGSELVNKNKCSTAVKGVLVDLLESRTKSKSAKKSSKHSANDASCSKACPNITVSSSKEMNKNVTLQESLSSELIGDFSELNVKDFLAPQEAASSTKAVSPKRKAAISPSTACSPAKMSRASSSAKTVSPKRKATISPKSTEGSPAKIPRASSAKTVSPKRKATISPKSTECTPAKIPRASSSAKTGSPKRKPTTSANSTEYSPAKIPRSSSECDPNESNVKEKQDESLNTQNLLKPESANVKPNISPKRKSEDVDSCAAGTSSSDAATED